MKTDERNDKISKIMGDSEKVREVIQAAINKALLDHKQAGNPVCGSENGKIYWVQPEDILVDNK